MSSTGDGFKDLTTSRGLVHIGNQKLWTTIIIVASGLAATGAIIYWVKIHHYGFPENEKLLKAGLKQVMAEKGLDVVNVEQETTVVDGFFGTITSAQVTEPNASPETTPGKLLGIAKKFLASLAPAKPED